MPAAVWRVGGRRLTALLSAWIFVAGTGHSLALQRWWDQRSAYPAQSRVLCQLTRDVPAVRPNTLILLIDDLGSFPAVFTFRHAVRYFYGGSAIGYVWGAHELFYPLHSKPTLSVTSPGRGSASHGTSRRRVTRTKRSSWST